MTEQEVLRTFREAGALLEGHFLYASGRHGRQFLQASRVLQFPEKTTALCSAMGASFADANVDIVCGPATGGIILAYETAKSLGVRSIFSEKEPDGSMAVKRGFHIPRRARVLIVEDVITTGGSVIKTIQHLVSRNAIIVGVAVLVDRSGGKAAFDCPYKPLAQIALESWPPSECPLCAAGEMLVDPDDIVLV